MGRMKAFDIELAKKRHPVQTRDGKPVRIICFDRKGNVPIVALVDMGDDAEHVRYYRANGRRSNTSDVSMDLVMAPVKKEGWVNVYKGDLGNFVAGGVFSTPGRAEDNIIGDYVYVTTTFIKWEE